ncbi:OmpW family outer membrane protein, partial [Escherichia coli]
TSKTPSYTKSVSWQHHQLGGAQQHDSVRLDPWVFMFSAGYRF